MNRDSDPAYDPLVQVREVKRLVQLGVYASIPTYAFVYYFILGMTGVQVAATVLVGLIIATVAIEGAFHFITRLQKQSHYPSALAIELGTVRDLQGCCDLAVQLACRWLGARAAYLIWLDDNNFTPAAVYGLDRHWFGQLPPPSLDDPAVRRAVDSARVTFAPVAADADNSPGAKSCTFAYVPLVARDGVAALLCLIADKKAADARDRKLLHSLGLVMGLSLDNTRLNVRQYESVMKVLSRALDMRDHATEGHAQRVASLSRLLAEQVGLPRQEVEKIEQAAALHDIGKIGVADAVLAKPSSLSDEEWEEMRHHPELGFQILKDIEFLEDAADIVYAHHERYDGSGYPRGLAGEEIPLGARIFAVVDAYDAITSQRSYRPARSHVEAVAEIRRCSGSQFDPRVMQAFCELVNHLGQGNGAKVASQPAETAEARGREPSSQAPCCP